MSSNQNNQEECNVKVMIDVTKIVKYVCITSVFIVSVIFGTKLSKELLSK